MAKHTLPKKPDALTRQTIEWVNEVRNALDKPLLLDLPQGERRDTWNCPITEALRACGVWAVTRISVFGESRDDEKRLYETTGMFGGEPGMGLRFPEESPVRRWIADFDNGRYPEYEVAHHLGV